jgi:hypothetical protein
MSNENDTRQQLLSELNRLCKWRKVLAGWQLGTRSDQDAEAAAVRDQRELLLLMRVELNALTNLLIQQGVITLRDFMEQQLVEITALDKSLEARFPGFQATPTGMLIDAKVAANTTKGWKP